MVVSLADLLWTLAYVVGAIGFLAMLDEAFPRLRELWLNRRARNRHPIIKDWK